MTEYTFKAYSKTGDLVIDRISASDQAEALSLLAARGLAAFEVKAGQQTAAGRRTRLPSRTLGVFCRQMATMLESDLPIDEALALIARDADPKAAGLAKQMHTAMLQGATASAALAAATPHVPEFMVGLVAAGETGGTLAGVFERLADSFEGQARIAETLLSALLYPAVLGVTAIGSLILVLTVVAPALAPVFAGAGDRTPIAAQLLMAASNGLRDYWGVIVLVILLAALVAVMGLRSPGGRAAMSRFLLKAPLVGPVVANTEGSRVLYSLAALLDNGVNLTAALEIARGATSNGTVAADIDRVTSEVRQGERLSEALARSTVFPPSAGQMAAVGEKSGGVEKLLRHCARGMEEGAQRHVRRLMSVATPALTIFLGVLVGGIVLSLLSAIMSVNDLALSGTP